MAKRSKGESLFDRMGDDSDVISRPPGGDESVSLHEAAQVRYLNYALSVITSRALPDVRDGLKPSQRRILVTFNDLNLSFDRPYRKCAKISGDVSGNIFTEGAQYKAAIPLCAPSKFFRLINP
jgi:DNA gyrase subunit A